MKSSLSRRSPSSGPKEAESVPPGRPDVSKEQFTEFFRSMRAVPLSGVRRTIMEVKTELRNSLDQSVHAPSAPSTAVEDELAPLRRRIKPPLEVKLRRLTSARFRELQHEQLIGRDPLQETALSPRSLILQECLQHPMVPFGIREILVESFARFRQINIRKGVLSNVEIDRGHIVSIDIHDFGIGDEKGVILSKALVLCPQIRRLNISGNRLTDSSMMPILTAVFSSLQCTSLNISNNKLDSDSIEVLKQSECSYCT